MTPPSHQDQHQQPTTMRSHANSIRRGWCLFCPSPAPYAVTCGDYHCAQLWRRLTPDDRHYLIVLRAQVRHPRTARRRWLETAGLAAAMAVTTTAFGVLAWPLLRLLIAGK